MVGFNELIFIYHIFLVWLSRLHGWMIVSLMPRSGQATKCEWTYLWYNNSEYYNYLLETCGVGIYHSLGEQLSLNIVGWSTLEKLNRRSRSMHSCWTNRPNIKIFILSVVLVAHSMLNIWICLRSTLCVHFKVNLSNLKMIVLEEAAHLWNHRYQTTIAYKLTYLNQDKFIYNKYFFFIG